MHKENNVRRIQPHLSNIVSGINKRTFYGLTFPNTVFGYRHAPVSAVPTLKQLQQ